MPENCSCVFSENAVRWVYEIKGVGRLSYAGLRWLAKISGFTDAAFLPVRELVVVPEYRRFCEPEPLRQLRCASGLPADERHGRGNDRCYAAV